MKYTYKENNYNKRNITNNVLIQIITTDFELVKLKSDKYVKLAETLKSAEEVSQSDACPIVGREQLRPVLVALRERIPELRARQTQTGTAVFTEKLEDISDEDAEFLIANGTIAHVAYSYSDEAIKILLSHGILPLQAGQSIDAGSFIFLEGIRKSLETENKNTTAFLVKEHLEPISLKVEYENTKQLEYIL